MKYASVKFKWSKDGSVYDYIIPDGMALSTGDKAIVETRRGETEVEIVAVKDESEMASAYIVRKAEPKIVEEMDF